MRSLTVRIWGCEVETPTFVEGDPWSSVYYFPNYEFWESFLLFSKEAAEYVTTEIEKVMINSQFGTKF